MNIRLNQVVIALSAVMLLTTTVDNAEARIRSKSSFSRGSTYSAPRAPSFAAAPRVGNGNSAGMSRPSVTEKARTAPSTLQPSPSQGTSGFSAPVKSPQYAPSYPAPARAPEPRRSGSWVAPAVAGVAAGALAGYALADNSAEPSSASSASPQAGATASPGQEARSADAPVGVGSAPSGLAGPIAGAPVQMPASAAAADDSSMGWFLLLALLAVGGAVLWAIIRKVPTSAAPRPRPVPMPGPLAMSAPSSHAASEGQSLLREAPQLFQEIQDLHNAANFGALGQRLTPEMLRGVVEGFEARIEESQTTVVSVDCALLDCTDEGHRLVASIHYKSLLSEHPSKPPVHVEEVWHFVKERHTSRWKLAGIEQV